MERSKRYHLLIDLESIQHELSSDYSLNICFRVVFLILMVHHFLHTSPYKMSVFERSVTCSFFWELTPARADHGAWSDHGQTMVDHGQTMVSASFPKNVTMV